MSTISAFDSRTCGINVEILSTSRSLKEFEIAAPILISSAVSFEISLTIYIVTGQYSSLTSYLGLKIFLKILLRNLFSIVIVEIICEFILGYRNPISFLSLIIIITTFLNLGFRYLIRKLLFLYSVNDQKIKSKIAIYGAGISGINLAKNFNIRSYILFEFIFKRTYLFNFKI